MTIRAGYWVDLAGLTFDEASTGTWIQAMPMGAYEHPTYGTITIDAPRVQHFADNVNNKVREQQLDIDYDHKAQNGEAAGWVKQADARADGLWLLVEWTKTAAQKIQEKAYRYFSPEFVDEWTHPKTKQKYQDVLFGGGITNRPFLKDILPINMSEVFEAARLGEFQKQEGKGMDPKKLRELLGLSEAATDEQVTAKLNELKTPQAPTQAQIDEALKARDEAAEAAAKLNEKNALPDDLKKLAESNPAIKKLTDMFEAQATILATQSKTLAETQVALKLSEIDSTVVKLNEQAKEKGYAFPPATIEEVRKLLTEAPSKAFADQVVAAFEKLGTTGLVKLGEIGGNSGGDHKDADSIKTFQEAVKAAQKANEKLDYADAVSKVSAEQPQLFEEYRQASFAGRE
jgi:phage I-like protein